MTPEGIRAAAVQAAAKRWALDEIAREEEGQTLQDWYLLDVQARVESILDALGEAGLNITAGPHLGYGVASRTDDGRWHLTPIVDNLTDTTSLAHTQRVLNETIPTTVYADQPAEFFTDVAVVELRRITADE